MGCDRLAATLQIRGSYAAFQQLSISYERRQREERA